ncbi:MAG: ParB/RepB/Spo0J family partition protein [Planctomycetota bacterium JB042]
MERRLSRGLEALLGKGGVQEAAQAATQTTQSIPLESVKPNPSQPRREFDEGALEELRASIEQDGLLQPIVVRRVAEGFEIIAGERRFRACQRLGMNRIPALIRTAEEDQRLVQALVENVQRSDLNAIEEARAYRQLLDEFGLTHEEVAKRVGKNRSTVTNALRLLDLPDSALDEVSRGTLSAGHARAMLPLVQSSRFDAFVRKVLDEGLSVRQTERVVRDILDGGAAEEDEPTSEKGGSRPKHRRRPLLTDLEDRLRARWGVLVRVEAGRRGGTISFKATSKEELNDLLERLEEGSSDHGRGSAEREFVV